MTPILMLISSSSTMFEYFTYIVIALLIFAGIGGLLIFKMTLSIKPAKKKKITKCADSIKQAYENRHGQVVEVTDASH